MFDMVDIFPLVIGRALIVCQFLQGSSKGKESSLYAIWNAHTAFLLCGAELIHLSWGSKVESTLVGITWLFFSEYTFTLFNKIGHLQQRSLVQIIFQIYFREHANVWRFVHIWLHLHCNELQCSNNHPCTNYCTVGTATKWTWIAVLCIELG